MEAVSAATLEISREQSFERLRAYEALAHEERTAEDDALIRGYRMASRGLPVISLSSAIKVGGFFPNGLPRIAVINADALECNATWYDDDIVFRDETTSGWGHANRGALVNRHTVRVRDIRPDSTPWNNGWSVVPVIPPEHRPRRSRLHRRHILWEVEEWKRGISPRDPALIEHIRGDLWAVHAVWNLTELERHVLSQRQ